MYRTSILKSVFGTRAQRLENVYVYGKFSIYIFCLLFLYNLFILTFFKFYKLMNKLFRLEPKYLPIFISANRMALVPYNKERIFNVVVEF